MTWFNLKWVTISKHAKHARLCLIHYVRQFKWNLDKTIDGHATGYSNLWPMLYNNNAVAARSISTNLKGGPTSKKERWCKECSDLRKIVYTRRSEFREKPSLPKWECHTDSRFIVKLVLVEAVQANFPPGLKIETKIFKNEFSYLATASTYLQSDQTWRNFATRKI